MKSRWKILIAGLVLVGLVTLVLAEDKPAKSAPPKTSGAPVSSLRSKASSHSDFPIIGYIEKRDRTITIKAGPKGTLYSVKSADGTVLFENLSAEQLRAKAPDLHDLIKTAVAGDARIIKVDAMR